MVLLQDMKEASKKYIEGLITHATVRLTHDEALYLKKSWNGILRNDRVHTQFRTYVSARANEIADTLLHEHIGVKKTSRKYFDGVVGKYNKITEPIQGTWSILYPDEANDLTMIAESIGTQLGRVAARNKVMDILPEHIQLPKMHLEQLGFTQANRIGSIQRIALA